jgi:pimeloyl-ACP methyl ester carboxylesterase
MSPPMSEPDPDTITFPGAQRPERTYKIDANGIGIAVAEWGDERDPPILLVHGGFDFAATFDGIAPRLAAHGMRVVAFDQRGHGDSEHAVLYGWDGDLRDTIAVIERIGAPGPIPAVGHSKGGSMLLQLADAEPHRFSHIVNLDGLPCKRRAPDIAEHDRTKLVAKDIEAWLDHRRRTAFASRKPDTLDGLARRRGRLNPRLPIEWLRYLVTRGARLDEDGWRWKIDASMRFGGFGPWRPEWTQMRLPGIGVPFLGVLVTEYEEMGWDTKPEDLAGWVPPDGRIEVVEESGHFVHIEHPDRVVSMIVELVGS